MTDRATPNLPSRDFDTTARFDEALGFVSEYRDDGWMILARGALSLEFFSHPEVNRANATIGRALRLVMLNVGGGWPGDLDKSTLGHPGKYTYAVCENELQSPLAPYHVEHGYKPEDSTVFVMAAEAPHSVTNHTPTILKASSTRCARR